MCCTKYIYTQDKGKNSGVLRRYALEGLTTLSFTSCDIHTPSHMIEEGGTIQDVAKYLGHTSYDALRVWLRFSIWLEGQNRCEDELADALREGAATGYIFDGVARLKIEALGDEAKQTPFLRINFHLKWRRDRVLHADIIEEIPIEPGEAAKFNQFRKWSSTLLGMEVVSCRRRQVIVRPPIRVLLEFSQGLEPTFGCGCKYLVLLPESVEQLNQDIAIMEAQIDEMKAKQWEGWRSHNGSKALPITERYVKLPKL